MFLCLVLFAPLLFFQPANGVGNPPAKSPEITVKFIPK